MKQGKYLIVHNGKMYVEYGKGEDEARATWAKSEKIDTKAAAGAKVSCVKEPRLTRAERLAAAQADEQKKKGKAADTPQAEK